MRTSNPAHAGSLTLDTRLTMAEMPDMALNKIMVGQGAGNSPVEEDKAGVAAKEFFIPAFTLSSNPAEYRGVLVSKAAESAECAILVPQDFTSITAIQVIFLPMETGASMYFDVLTEYGAYNGGEAYNVHSEDATARDIGATTSGRNLAHSISDLVDIAALAAGDLLFVRVSYNATVIASNAYVRGIRFIYS